MSELAPSVRKVEAALAGSGVSFELRQLDRSTRTAADAASTLGCSVAQIAKSILFRVAEGDTAVLVIASGANRVDEAALARLLGQPVQKADAAFVRERTGFAIGGVPPVGHDRPITTFIDEDLLGFEEVWAAAGTPFAVVRLRAAALAPLTGGTVAALALQD